MTGESSSSALDHLCISKDNFIIFINNPETGSGATGLS
jgi:hypothetical protein